MIYQDEDGITKISVKFSDEDIWLTQNQIAEICKTSQENISMHIKNIYNDGELENNLRGSPIYRTSSLKWKKGKYR